MCYCKQCVLLWTVCVTVNTAGNLWRNVLSDVHFPSCPFVNCKIVDEIIHFKGGRGERGGKWLSNIFLPKYSFFFYWVQAGKLEKYKYLGGVNRQKWNKLVFPLSRLLHQLTSPITMADFTPPPRKLLALVRAGRRSVAGCLFALTTKIENIDTTNHCTSKEDVPTWCKQFYYDFFS